MRKLQKAAVLVATLGSVSILGAGSAHAVGADDPKSRNFTNNNANIPTANSCSISKGGSVIGDINLTIALFGRPVVDPKPEQACYQWGGRLGSLGGGNDGGGNDGGGNDGGGNYRSAQ